MSKQTSPLAKAYTTTEGILSIAITAAVAAVSAIDPSTLPPKWAGVFATISTGLLTAQRGLIKVAALKTVGNVVNAPDPIKAVEDVILADINKPAPPVGA